MEAKKKRNIKSGVEYDHLFPRSENDNKTIRRNANVYHTVDFIPKVVKETLEQTKSISKILKGTTTYETCSNIWHFVYGHINYKKDNDGYEQIRSPARTWHDRIQGVDCDCYSVFISSILMNMDIPHSLRITKYHRDYFQHIYPIVPYNGKYITIDCVTDNFNYEVPFSEKKDYPMDLQYLNGFDGDGMDELGKIIKRNMATKKPTTPTAKKANPSQRPNPKPVKKAGGLLKKIKSKAASKPTAAASSQPSVPAVKQKKKGLLKKVVSAVNKVNPATVLLRNGILAAMKLNVKNVAARLRWSYLTPEQASAKGVDPAKFPKLIATRQKLEKIFDVAGGKIANLKKAILSGKGNKDKAVNGLGMLPMVEWAGYMSEYTSLDQLLGPEIYYSENVDGMEGFSGFGELGEPVTLATVGAAMGVIAGIVAALKQIGDIFKSKQKGSEDFDESKTDAPENTVDVPKTDTSSIKVSTASTNDIIPDSSTQNFVSNASENNITESQDSPIKTSNELPATYNRNEIVPQAESEDKLSLTTTDENATSNADTNKESFWDKNKKWLKPVAIGVGGLTLIAIGFKMLKGKEQNKSSPKSRSLSGLPRKKKKKYKKYKNKHNHKRAIALL
jgi:hypothetical protein